MRALDIPLEGTRGDDLYYTINNFQINGVNYPADATVTLTAINKAGNTMTGVGTLSGSSVTIKIPHTDTQVAGKYTYDVEIEYQSGPEAGDLFTHIKSTLILYDDVKKA